MTHYFGYSPVGDKFWLKVFNDLRTRGVNDILIGVVDGLKGLAEAFESVPPGSKF
jgi:transposase-like protein